MQLMTEASMGLRGLPAPVVSLIPLVIDSLCSDVAREERAPGRT